MAKFSLKKFGIVIACIALFSIGLYRYQETGDNILDIWASYATYPFILFQKTINTKIGKIKRNLACIEDLNNEVENLKIINEDLQGQNLQLQSIKDFVDQTAEVREFANRYSKPGILTQVLMKVFNNQNNFFLVDAGFNKDIKVDMVVIYKDCLVGRVIEVFPDYSKVILITDKNCKVAAYCSESKVSGIHEGINKIDSTRLSFVHHLLKVKDNDLVFSSGEGLVFPKGFALGKIKTNRLDGLNYDITIKPILDFNALTYCYIIPKEVTIN